MEVIQPVAIEPAPAPDGETKAMRSAYNRGVLGLFVEINLFQIVATLILSVAAGVLAVLKVVPLIQAQGLKPMGLLQNPETLIDLLKTYGILRWIIVFYAIGATVGMIVGILVMRPIVGKSTPIEKRRLGIGKFLLVVLFSFGLWGVGAALGNLPSFFGATEAGGLDQLLSGKDAWPMLLYTCIGAPLFEELVCRKLLLDKLHPYGEGYAAIASGLLFGLIHGNSGQFFLAFLVGLLFAMVYLRTGRVLYTILLHAIINTTASLPSFFSMANVDIELGWNIGAGVLVAAGLVALIVFRKDALLHPQKSTVLNANNAAWRNVGMILSRVFFLVSLVFTDLLMMALPLLQGGSPAGLLRLIPMTAAIVLVLVLPKLTRRFEAPAPEMTEGEPHEPEAAVSDGQ